MIGNSFNCFRGVDFPLFEGQVGVDLRQLQTYFGFSFREIDRLKRADIVEEERISCHLKQWSNKKIKFIPHLAEIKS